MEYSETLEFEQLLTHVEDLARSGQQSKLVVLLKTSSGTVYHRFITDIEDSAQLLTLLEELKVKNDTRVRILVNMFTEGLCLDAPSYAFRTGLIEMNPENCAAMVPVVGERNGKKVYFVRLLSDFIPKQGKQIKE